MLVPGSAGMPRSPTGSNEVRYWGWSRRLSGRAVTTGADPEQTFDLNGWAITPHAVEMTYVPDRSYSPIGTDGTIARPPLDAIGKHLVGKRRATTSRVPRHRHGLAR